MPEQAQESRPAATEVDAGFVIGVIDTGVVALDGRPHPFLEPNLAQGWEEDLLGGGSLDGHGTFVAGQIVLQARRATIAVHNTLDATGEDEKVALAIRALAAEPNLKLVNLSFFSGGEVFPPGRIEAALQYLFGERPDVLVVVAAGNGWTSAPTWPGAFNQQFPGRVIAVGAVDGTVLGTGEALPPPKASFSNYGRWVDLYAEGVNLLGPQSFAEEPAGWARWSGTSFAAAIVTGRIAEQMLAEPELGALGARDRIATGKLVELAAEGDRRPYVPRRV
jgi:subtilisin family serine protease